MSTVEVIHKVQLVDGEFTPSEAADIIRALIKEKINFHKLNRLSSWVGNADGDTSYDDSRVAQLEKAQNEFIKVCQEARARGKQIKINGILDVELIDK